jgi:two-component system NarL family sensor kinase
MTTDPAVDAAWSRAVLADRREPPASRGQVQETTRRLIYGSLAGLVILAAAGYLVGARLAERQVLVDAERFSSLLGNALVGPRVTPALLAGDPAARSELDSLIQHRLVRHTSLRRVKVWSSSGRVLYSDDAREVGHSFPLNASQRDALRTGKPVAEVSDLSREESELERRFGPRLLEIYTMVRSDDGQRVLFEAYISYDQVRDQRAAVFTMLSLLAAAGVVLFAGFQVALGRMNLRWVRRREEDLRERALLLSDRARERVARDLHDGTVQDLVGASYVVDGALQSIRGRGMKETERLMEGAASSVRSSIHSLRSVMIEVYPRTIQERGLAAALNDLARPMRTRGLNVEVSVDVHGHVSAETTEALYRAAQEAVRNILHHARAAAVRLCVDAAADATYVRMRIIDDGVGLPPGRVRSPEGHLGLHALTDIVAERHGCLEIWSAPGKGTDVRMEMLR